MKARCGEAKQFYRIPRLLNPSCVLVLSNLLPKQGGRIRTLICLVYGMCRHQSLVGDAEKATDLQGLRLIDFPDEFR